MISLMPFQMFDAGIHLALALVWALVAQNTWRFLRRRETPGRFFRMLPLVAGTVAFTYGVFTVISLIPVEIRKQGSYGVLLIFALHDWCIFSIVALARHMARFFPSPEELPAPPGWLVANYGPSLLMDMLTLAFLGLVRVPFTEPGFSQYFILRVLYQLVMLGLIVLRVVRIARPGAWGPGGATWVARRADVVFLTGALVSLVGWLLVAATTDWTQSAWFESTPLSIVLDTVAGIGWAVPLAVRILGEVVRGFLVVVAMSLASAIVYLGAHRLGASLSTPQLLPIIDLGAICAFVCILVPGQAWLRGAIDGVVFRRSRRRREELQALLHTLSPELAVYECCRRALSEVTRVMRLRGAALLRRGGETMVHGGITCAPVERLWSDNAWADAALTHGLVGYELLELPNTLREALTETDVVGVFPINSPRRRWGVLLISTGLLGATFAGEDEQALEAFADQLALVLDGSELLARTVAVERSLAHSEKLAAIGELAARVAHEIRNPVTAARSLAQQLAREPASPLNAEHAALILTELERVERQVAALLRFARRDEFRFQTTDVGTLVRTTVDDLRTRLDAAGIDCVLRCGDSIRARIDPEKVRQVLLNLIENAMDALRDADGRRTLAVAVGAQDGSVTLTVTDNGPGVPADALPQLFDPFFSLKPNGTGLGLAIAKRTAEAHGGRMEAVNDDGGGMTVRVDLPLVAAE